MLDHKKAKVLQSKQLFQLHSMRTMACERAYREVQKKQQQAQKDVDERQAAIDKLLHERHSAIEYGRSDRVTASPALVKTVHSRCYWVNYDLEKDMYYLGLDKGALKDAVVECEKAKNKWLQAQRRENGAEKMFNKSQNDLQSILDHRQEMEAEELVGSKVNS